VFLKWHGSTSGKMFYDYNKAAGDEKIIRVL
jgi:hypothetical protein